MMKKFKVLLGAYAFVVLAIAPVSAADWSYLIDQTVTFTNADGSSTMLYFVDASKALLKQADGAVVEGTWNGTDTQWCVDVAEQPTCYDAKPGEGGTSGTMKYQDQDLTWSIAPGKGF